LKKFYAEHSPANTVETLQKLCDQFRWDYNHESPHRFLNQQAPSAGRERTPNPA
jgi:transposase InsO family protein